MMQPSLWRAFLIAFTVAVAVVSLAFLTWVGLAVWNRTAPAWVYVMVFLVLAALGGEGRRRGRRRSAGNAQDDVSVESVGRGVLAAVLALAVFAGVAFFATNYASRSWRAFSTQRQMAPSQPSATTPAINVPQAKQALQQSSPVIFAALVDPNRPETAVVGDVVTYEWEYLEKPTAASVQVKRIKITLDAEGRLVGVDGS